MNLSISVTFDLGDYDQKIYKYCLDNQHDAPDYTTLVDRIQIDIEQLDGLDEVVFNHMSWVKVGLGTDDFEAAAKEAAIVKNEIRQVYAKYGVK
jgi:hypothetical protein